MLVVRFRSDRERLGFYEIVALAARWLKDCDDARRITGSRTRCFVRNGSVRMEFKI